MDPVFLVDLRDRATGKAVAVRVTRDQALLPVGELARRVLLTPTDDLVTAGRLAPAQADRHFRIADLLYPVDRHGRLASTPYTGLEWRHARDGFRIDPAAPALFERTRRAAGPDVLALPLEADRANVRYERNWAGFHARRHSRFSAFAERFVTELPPSARGDERAFIEGAARRIWHADFENYSRFLPADGVRLKTGDETVAAILAGRGGVCTEKVLALKWITDAHGLASRVVFAGPDAVAPVPVQTLRAMLDQLDTWDFSMSRRTLRYWDHVALEYELPGGERLLVDPSNGNIPFLCGPSAPFLDGEPGRPVPVRMLAVEEPVHYHRVPEKLAEDFLFAWETWVGDVDLLQVFDNKLGLLMTDDFCVVPVLTGSATKRAVSLDGWRTYAAEHGLVMGLIDGPGATSVERATAAAFGELHPERAAHSLMALPGLEARYRTHIFAHHGLDKPFHADLLVLDRRPLLARLGREEQRAALVRRSA